MSKHTIPTDEFLVQVNKLWLKQWFLLTCGDFAAKEFNTMTVAWGSFGVMWNKPMAMVVVRPTRYTYNFINNYPTFTLCAFPDQYQDDLFLLYLAFYSVHTPLQGRDDLIAKYEARRKTWLDGGEPSATRIEDNIQSFTMIIAAMETTLDGQPKRIADYLSDLGL